MGSGEVAIVALSTMISLKVTFSDGLGGSSFLPIAPHGICDRLRSVGEFSHLLFQAHWALSFLPQISQICTDAFHVQPAKESVLICCAGGASKPSSRQRSKSK